MCEKPKKIVVTREQARAWNTAEMLIQVKADGVFSERKVLWGDAVVLVLGEFVTCKSGGFLSPLHRRMLESFPCGFFVAFDVTYPDLTTRERWNLLTTIEPFFPCDMVLVERLEAGEIPPGAEGIVGKPWDAPYGDMFACKVLETRLCVVTSIGGSRAVGIAENVGGSLVDRGRVTLAGGKVERVRVGSVVKVDGMGLTEAGKIREPKVHNDDGWLVKF